MDEYARKQSFASTVNVDPFAFGDESIEKNKKELELNQPDPVLRLQWQIENNVGVG